MGSRIRVEVARGRPRGDRFEDRRRGPPSTGFRVTVRGLPENASWQDLKDHFRKVAPPAFSDVKRSRNGPLGIVEFETGGDMDRAIRELDGSLFRNQYGEGTITVMEDKLGPPGGRGRGPPPPARGRYRSRSPPRGRRPRSFSPRGRRGDSRSPSPRGRPYSRSPSPRKRPDSRSPSPRGRRGGSRSPSPRGRPYSRSPSPRRRPDSRSPSPRRRPDSRSPSPRRSRSPVGRYEPRED